MLTFKQRVYKLSLNTTDGQSKVIRWYDWAVAFLAADFMFANISLAFIGPVWYIQLFGVCTAYFIYDLWIDYCNFRKKHEYGKQ